MPQNIRFKKILITGSSGQLGRCLIGQLNDHRGDIVALDIDNDELATDERPIITIRADITKPEELNKHRDVLANVDFMIHLASIIEDSTDIKKDSEKSIDVDIMGTLNLLRFLPELKGICYSSSYMVYGPTAYLPVDENHPTEPQNIYGVCKLAVEKLLRLYALEQHVPTAVLRYSGIYGPGTPVESKRMIPSFIRRVSEGQAPEIYGEGTVRRIGLYIDDAAAAVLRVMEQADPELFQVYNISSGKSFTAAELAELVIRLSGKDLRPHYENPEGMAGDSLRDIEMDISRAKEKLGFEPEHTLDAGIREHMDWYRQQTVKK